MALSEPDPALESAPREIEVPQFERDLQPPSAQPIPIERAILLSLAFHIFLFLLLFWAPSPSRHNSEKGLLAGLLPPTQESPESKIPVIFRSSPGPERENPKRSDLSDKSRRAGGGDRSRPKSETPFVPRRPGVEGLASGAGKMARAAPPSRPTSGDKREQTATAGERTTAPDGFRVPPPGTASTGVDGAKFDDLQRAIQDAARAQVQGEGGADFPNPEGGFVDTGPVSFETNWFDWGDYVAAMLRRLKLHWAPLRDPFKGWVTFRWVILPDGRVEDIQKVATSGNPAYDYMALQAIIGSNPFRPLPKELLDQVGHDHREHVTVTFIYNYTFSEFERIRGGR